MFNDKVHAFLVISTVTTLLAILIWLKFDGYRAWRYFSDLFSFFSVIRETARGFIGLDFVYGNAFGDHAYWFLLVISPLYHLFKSQVVYILLAAAPIAYWASAILLYFTLRLFTQKVTALFIALTYTIGYHHIFRGLFEEVFGMHPEIVAGFVLVIIVCLMLIRNNRTDINVNTQRLDSMVFALFVLYALLKEEMVLLMVAYWAVIFLLTRKKSALVWLILSIALLIIDLALIQYFRTPYNRTNELLLANFISRLQSRPLVNFLFYNYDSGVLEWPFWAFVTGSTLLFTFIIKFTKKVYPPVIALFVCGIAKLLIGILVTDFNLISWHNYSGLVMVLASLQLAVGLLSKKNPKISLAVSALLVSISLFTFIKFDLDYIYWNYAKNVDSRYRIAIFSDDFNAIRSQVDPMRVTSIQSYSARSWINYRNNFYPHRENVSPFEIADYIVLPLGEAEKFWRLAEVPFTEKDIPENFAEKDRNDNFVLYQRTAFSQRDLETRAYFARYDVPQDLPPWPK